MRMAIGKKPFSELRTAAKNCTQSSSHQYVTMLYANMYNIEGNGTSGQKAAGTSGQKATRTKVTAWSYCVGWTVLTRARS